jgi:hypothetical protein
MKIRSNSKNSKVSDNASPVGSAAGWSDDEFGFNEVLESFAFSKMGGERASKPSSPAYCKSPGRPQGNFSTFRAMASEKRKGS